LFISSSKLTNDSLIKFLTMQEIRYLDKLIDELAKGKAMDKILKNVKNNTAKADN